MTPLAGPEQSDHAARVESCQIDVSMSARELAALREEIRVAIADGSSNARLWQLNTAWRSAYDELDRHLAALARLESKPDTRVRTQDDVLDH